MIRAFRLVSFFLLVTGGWATAQSRIDCSALNSRILKQVVHYCVYLPAGYDAGATQHPPRRYPVLYFLHGLGDNEQTLFKSGGWTLLDDLRSQHKMGDFLIVAPEGRRSFYINSADGSVRYNDFFLQEFIPQIESKYRILPGRSGRAISGISMGGYGALRFGFAHPELFSAVSAQSAALITDSPQTLDSASRAGAPLAGVLTQSSASRSTWLTGMKTARSCWQKETPWLCERRLSISTVARTTITASKKAQRLYTRNCKKKWSNMSITRTPATTA